MRLQNASAPRYERAYAAYVLALMGENRQETAAGARNLLKTPQDDFAAFLATAALLESGFSGEAWPHLNRLLAKEIWRTDDSTPHFVRPAARAADRRVAEGARSRRHNAIADDCRQNAAASCNQQSSAQRDGGGL